MAINIDTLVHNEFSRSASDQLEKIIRKPANQVSSGVNRAVTEMLDNFSLMAREESGRQAIYEASRYSDDGLIDDPSIFFSGKSESAAIGDSNAALAKLLGSDARQNIADAVRSSSDLSAQEADTITGYVAPGVLGVMKRQMLNGAVLDNSDGIGQMLLGETVTATVGGAGASIDHSVPKNAPRRAGGDVTHASAAARTSSAPVSDAARAPAATASGSGAAVAHDDGADLSWLFRWAMPALLLGGLVLAGLNNCSSQNQVAAVDTESEALLAVKSELDMVRGETDGLNAQIVSLTGERDAASAEIVSLKDQLAQPADTSELDAANAEIASLKDQLAQPADTSELDAANAEIASLKTQLAQPADTSGIAAANAQIAQLQSQLANMAAPGDNSAQIMSLQSSVDDSTLKIAQLESELDTVRSSRDELEQSMAQLRAEKTSAASRTEELKEKLLNVAGAKNRLEAEIEGLETAVADSEAMVAEKDAMGAEKDSVISALTSERDGANGKIQILQSNLGRAIDDASTKRKAAVASQSDLLTLQQAAVAKDAELAKVKKGRSAAISTVSDLARKLRASQTENGALEASLTGEIDSLKKKAERNEFELAKMTRARKYAKNKWTENADALAALQSKAKRNDFELAKMTRARQYAKNKWTENADELAALKSKARRTDSELANRNRSLKYLKEQRIEKANELAGLQSKIESTERNLTNKTRAFDFVKNQWAGNKAELDALKSKTKRNDFELAKMTRARKYAKNKWTETEAELEKATRGKNAAVSTIKDLLGKLRTTGSERDGLAADKTGLEESMAAAEADLEKATRGRNAAVSTIKDLLAKLRTAGSERDALAADKAGLEQAMADAESAMQSQKDEVVSLSASLGDRLAAAGVGDVTVNPVEEFQAVGITMGSSDLYGVGSASLSGQGVNMLDTVGSIVSEYSDWRIDVEGHTDGQPIGSALRQKYESNWELSVARAAAAVRYLQARVGIPADKLSVRGFGEHRPVDTNATAEGREANRRIELILRR